MRKKIYGRCRKIIKEYINYGKIIAKKFYVIFNFVPVSVCSLFIVACECGEREAKYYYKTNEENMSRAFKIAYILFGFNCMYKY